MADIFVRAARGSTERLPPAPTYTKPVTFRYEIQHHATRMQKLMKAFQVYRITSLTLICVVAGLSLGLLSRRYAADWTERQFMYIEMPGELYLRFLKLMILPLIVSNVILSFGTIQSKLSSQLAKVASFIYLGSNLMAITVAIVLALLMCPGRSTAERKPPDYNNIAIDKHHYFTEYHDSINRYREYHPMFYHTSRDGNNEKALTHQDTVQRSANPFQSVENNLTSISISANVDILMNKGEEEDELKKTKDESPIVVGSSDYSSRSAEEKMGKNVRLGLSTKLPIDVILDLLRNLVPDSIIGATLKQTRTRLFAPKELVIGSNISKDLPPSRWPMGHEMVDQANIIGLLAVSVLTGVILSHMEEAGRPMLDLCACISELSLRVGMLAIHLAPICIMFLLIGQVARARDLSSMAGELLMYSITVLVGLFVHGFILLPLVYYLITKKSPIKFLFNLLEALIASFATSSSSATMALMLNCLEQDLNPVIVRAFGPLGSVFNMNGTAVFEAIGVIFIAQTLGVTLPLTSLLLVALGSAVASLSTAGIPSSGMTTMVIVLNAVNLPVLQLSLIYIVDFVIDRFRTVINVWSAAISCGLIDHICPEHLFEEDMEPEKYKEMLKYHRSRCPLSRKVSNDEESVQPQIISVTITPPLESSCM